VAVELDHVRVRKANPTALFDSTRLVPMWWERIPLRARRIIVGRATGGRKLLTLAEAADRLGVSESAVNAAIRCGELRPIAGRPTTLGVRLTSAMVNDYLEGRRVQPARVRSRQARPATPRSGYVKVGTAPCPAAAPSEVTFSGGSHGG